MLALVTRPRAEAEALAALLAQRGIDAVIEPMIEIVDPGAAPLSLTGVQAILCTSANGVRALARTSTARDVPVFAVGDATARAARVAGFHAVDSAGGDVDDLARLVTRRLQPTAGRLVHIAGSDVAGDLAGALGAAGFGVERAVLYEACAAEVLSPLTARLIDHGEIDFALFFSPRSAVIFARLVTTAAVGQGLMATVAISISRAADAGLSSLPFSERLVTDAPTQAALLTLVEQLTGQPAEMRA